MPQAVETYVDSARDIARADAGVRGLLPLRLVEVRCGALGRGFSLAFEDPLGRVYASVSLPPTGVADPPDQVVVVAAATAEEHEAFMDACP